MDKIGLALTQRLLPPHCIIFIFNLKIFHRNLTTDLIRNVLVSGQNDDSIETIVKTAHIAYGWITRGIEPNFNILADQILIFFSFRFQFKINFYNFWFLFQDEGKNNSKL